MYSFNLYSARELFEMIEANTEENAFLKKDIVDTGDEEPSNDLKTRIRFNELTIAYSENALLCRTEFEKSEQIDVDSLFIEEFKLFQSLCSKESTLYDLLGARIALMSEIMEKYHRLWNKSNNNSKFDYDEYEEVWPHEASQES